MRKITVVMIAAHACIRVTKEALSLITNGYDVHIIAQKAPTLVNHYRSFGMCFDQMHFTESIRVYAGIADIFHAHNEPSCFVGMVKEVCDKPVILDVHDSFLARITPDEEESNLKNGKKRTRIQTEERNNFQMADGLVFPSEPFGSLITDEFRLDTPSIVLPSYVPETLYVYSTREWWGGLVYEGRVDLKAEVEKDDKLAGFNYCQYEDLASDCKKAGIDFHVQSVRKDEPFIKAFEGTAFLQPPAPYDDLLYKLSRHDWGLVGNSFYTPEWDVAFPNKLFEYIAAGVPVVAINARYCGEFVREHGIGIEVKSMKELASRWKEHRKCRENLYKKRKQFMMDTHIHELEGLYVKVLNGHR